MCLLQNLHIQNVKCALKLNPLACCTFFFLTSGEIVQCQPRASNGGDRHKIVGDDMESVIIIPIDVGNHAKMLPLKVQFTLESDKVKKTVYLHQLDGSIEMSDAKVQRMQRPLSVDVVGGI